MTHAKTTIMDKLLDFLVLITHQLMDFCWNIWHINTFSCIYIFIYTLCMWDVCRANYDRLCPEMISWHPVLGCPPVMMCPPVMISLAYPDCYLCGYSHVADINRHQDRYNLFAPDRLIRRPQCIVITLTGEPLAPVKLIHRLQFIVIRLPDGEFGLRCPSATCHYVTHCLLNKHW